MKKVITKTTKNPTRTVQVSGSTTSYDIQTKACLTNYEIASTGTAATEKITKFSRKSNRYDLLRNQHRNYKEELLGGLLTQMFDRRRRYSFQMIKLLYMFPDDTFSENISVNSYDRLFYQDQHVHTIVKIYQTLQMQAKIWAFLNLKTLHTRRKLQKFTNKIQKVQKRLILEKQKVSFDLIHQFSIKIRPQLKPQIRTYVKPQVIRPQIRPIIKKQITQITQSKTIIQRKQPISTRIQFKSPPKSSYEPIKTQRIEQNNYSSIRAQNTNQVIRISALESSPLVRRIQLSPDNGMRVIMPPQNRTYVSQKSTHEIRSTQTKLPDPPIKVNQQSRLTYVKENESKVIYPSSRTVIGTQRRVQYHRPSMYEAETIRRIQPIQSVPIYTKPVQVRQVRQVKQVNRSDINSNGYYGLRPDALVHTVHGDCTINIHNGCSHSQQKTQRISQTQRNRSPNHSRHFSHAHHSHHSQPSITINLPINTNCLCYQCQASMRSALHVGHHIQGQAAYCGHCGYSSATNCCGFNSNINYSPHGGMNYQMSPYSIEERIQYMKHLEHINNINTNSKLDSTKYAKEC